MNERPLPIAHTIRRAERADARAIGTMRAAQQAELGWALPGDFNAAYAVECERFFERELDASPPWLFGWIADVDGRPVGSAVLTLARGMPRPGRSGAGPDGRIRSVYVAPDLRRHGIGRELMRVALAAAESAGVVRLMLGASAQGRPLYEQLGFVLKGDEMVYEGTG